MFQVSSSTLFRVLCGAIVIMAIGLLALAGTMVLSYVQPEEPATLASPKVVGSAGSLRPVEIDANSRLAMAKLWPSSKGGPGNSEPMVMDDWNQVIFIGMWGDSAFFQHKGTRKQWRVKIGQASENIKLVALNSTDKQAEIRGVVNNTENPQVIKLRLVDAMESTPAVRGRPTGPTGGPTGGGGPPPSGVGGPGSGGRPSGGPTASSSPAATADRTTVTIGTSGGAAGSSGPAAASGPQRFTSAPIRTTSRSTSVGGTAAGGAESPTAPSSGGASPGSSSNPNWRQYWADRMKARQQQQENTGAPEGR